MKTNIRKRLLKYLRSKLRRKIFTPERRDCLSHRVPPWAKQMGLSPGRYRDAMKAQLPKESIEALKRWKSGRTVRKTADDGSFRDVPSIVSLGRKEYPSYSEKQWSEMAGRLHCHLFHS